MIVSRLFCGLRKRMFQYAAGLALAHVRNTVLKLDVSWFSQGTAAVARERYGLDCFVLESHFATQWKLTRSNLFLNIDSGGSVANLFTL